jgi:hypothetical protein
MTMQQCEARVSCCSTHAVIVQPLDQLAFLMPCRRCDILATGRGAFTEVHEGPPDALEDTDCVSRRLHRHCSGAFASRPLVAASLHSGDMRAGIAALHTSANDSWVLTTAITQPNGRGDARRPDRSDDTHAI